MVVVDLGQLPNRYVLAWVTYPNFMLQFRLKTQRRFQKNNYYTSTMIARQPLSGVGDKNRTCFHGFAIQCPSNWLHLHNSGTPSRNRTHIHSLEESCILHYTIGIWYEWRDLNPQSIKRQILSLMCIPFHHTRNNSIIL